MQNLGTIDNTYTILSIKNTEGPYATYRVRHNQTNNLHLIDVYRNQIPANLMNIMNNLIAINHPNVIHVIGHGNGPIALNNHPQVNRPYIVYENVIHSDLYAYILIQHFTERQAKWIFKKILEGVQALHNANICHRDLNTENILLDENYMAPEILLNQPYNGITADIFSLGQILFNLVTGLYGFHAARPNDQFYNLIIQQNIAQYWQNLGNQINVSQEFKNLFIRMVDPNPAQRPTIAQILNDPWMQEINNLNEEQRNALENEVRNEFKIREQQVHLNPQIQQEPQNQQNQQNR